VGMPQPVVRNLVARLPVELVDGDADLALRAADMAPLTKPFGLSLGDRFCLALAARSGVPAFTAGNGTTTLASSTANTVTLRWSRFVATPTGASTNSLFNVTSLPGYFGFTQASILETEIFPGAQGTRGATNLDGITNGSAPGTTAVGVRALFIEDPGNTLVPAFFAAKVRQH